MYTGGLIMAFVNEKLTDKDKEFQTVEKPHLR